MQDFSAVYKFMEICPDVTIRHGVFEVPGPARKRITEIFGPQKTGRAFRSVFLHDASYLAYINEHHTNAGYPGNCWSDKIIIDLDDNVSIVEAHGVARRLLDRLHADFEVNPKSVEVAFSGNRGFHISIPQEIVGFAPSQQLGRLMRAFVAKLFDVEGLAPGATGDNIFFLAGDAKTTKIDLSIYKVNGLIRIAGSKHEKTGNYKVFLTEKELFDLTTEEISALSKEQRKRPAYDPPQHNAALAEIWAALETAQSKPPERKHIVLPVINGIEIRPDQRMCMQRIMNDPVPEGEGDERAIRLAIHMASLGTPPEIVDGIMRSWNGKMERPMPEEQISAKIRSGLLRKNYYYGCDDAILASLCDTRCFKYKDIAATKDDAVHIQSVADLKEKFIAVIRDRRGIGFGIEGADFFCRRILPGEVCIEVACSGVGKTTIMMDQIVKLRKETGKPMLFLQQELHDVAIMERIVRHSSGFDIVEVEQKYLACERNQDMTPIDVILDRAAQKYEGVYFCTLDGLSTERKIQLIKAAQAKHGQLGAVFEDYIGRGDAPGSNFSEILTRLALGIKRAAKECEVPYFCAAQAITVEGLNAATPLTANSIRDSRQPFINADFVFGFSRPDNKVLVQILKNRRGADGKDFYLLPDFVRGEFKKVDYSREKEFVVTPHTH